nr:DUF2459 domain-containing protein [Flavimaribacter sediminis]
MKISIYTVATVFCLAGAYLVAAAIGTVWRTPPTETLTAQTTTAYVLSNGFHSDIVLPIEGGKLPAGFPELQQDLDVLLENTDYLIIGWGSQTAYTSLLELSDLTAGIIAKALFFDRSVLHIQPYSGSLQGPGVYRLELESAQLDQLWSFVAQTFLVDSNAAPTLIPDVTHGYGDVFYRAEPRFSLFYGCNAWVGEALRSAGLSFGRWTPFAQSIEWNMKRLQDHSRVGASE